MEEFEQLTPGMFQELCKRRNVSIKHNRYANALTASAVYNVNRRSVEDGTISAFDFVRDEEQSAKLERKRKAKKYVSQCIGRMPMMTTKEKLLEIRLKAIVDLKNDGYEDAEQIFNEVWPHLKPDNEV